MKYFNIREEEVKNKVTQIFQMLLRCSLNLF